MGFWIGSQDELKAEIAALRGEIAGLKIEKQSFTKTRDLQAEVLRLTEQVETMKIQKARLTEEQNTKEREVRHEVGLLRKQVEAEREIAVGRAKLEAEQGALADQQKVFEKEMKFTRDRFGEEVKYLREIGQAMLDRLPVVKVNKSIRESDQPEPPAEG